MSRLRPWLIAARPATLWASVAPVLVGSGLAWGQEAFRADAFAVALTSAVLINIGANFANDASDARRGADGAARIGPTRAVASGLVSPRQMWAGVAVPVLLHTVNGLHVYFPSDASLGYHNCTESIAFSVGLDRGVDGEPSFNSGFDGGFCSFTLVKKATASGEKTLVTGLSAKVVEYLNPTNSHMITDGELQATK